MNTLMVEPNLEEQIGQAQKEDPYLTTNKSNTGKGKAPGFRVDEKGTLWYKDQICVTKKGDLRQVIRGTQLCILHSPRSHKNVYGFEKEILVAWNEKRHRRVRRQVRRMQESQGRTSKACRTPATLTYPRIEI